MFKSYLHFARILMKNSFTASPVISNTSNVWKTATIRPWECRYSSDSGPKSTKPQQNDERQRKIVEAEVRLRIVK